MNVGTSARTAIACVTRLAEARRTGEPIKADVIARDRQLRVPFVRKVLTQLAHDGLVSSVPGPRGGFTLARPPERISLADVVERFERSADRSICPFGGGVCGEGEACPLHDSLAEVRRAMERFLQETTFAAFSPPLDQEDPGKEVEAKE